MINNNDMIKATCSNNYVYEWHLSRNVLYNIYFIERMPLAFLFRWSYRKGDYKDMAFEVNLFDGD